MKKQLLVLCLAALTPLGVSSQSWLKKIEQGVKKVTEKTTQTEGKSDNETKQEEQKTTETSKQDVKTPVVVDKGVVPYMSDNTRYVYVPSGADMKMFVDDGMIRIRHEYDHAYFNVNGDMIFDYKWKDGIFNSGACAVEISNKEFGKSKFAILYKDGSYRILPANYIQLTNFTDGVAIASIQEGGPSLMTSSYKTAYVDMKGEVIFPAITFKSKTGHMIQGPYPLSDGMRAYYDPEKKLFGYIDDKGKIVVAAQFVIAGEFSEGLAPVSLKEISWNTHQWAFIDKTGKVVFNLRDYESLIKVNRKGDKDRIAGFTNGYCVVKASDDDGTVCYYVDRTGKKVSAEYESALPFMDGYALIRNFQKTEGRTDQPEEHTMVVNTKFAEVGASHNFGTISTPKYSDGLICIYRDGSILYFIEPQGKTVLSTGDYSNHISDFNGGYAYCRIYKDKKQYEGIIDKTGEFKVIFANSRDLDMPELVGTNKNVTGLK